MSFVRDYFKLKEILIVPNRQNPLRAVMQGPTPEQRYEMVNLGIEELDQQKFRILDLEIKRAGLSYTVDTIDIIKKNNKSAEIFLIIGVENLKNFHEWKNFSKILKTVNLIVTSRPGNDLPKSKEELPGWLKEFSKIVMPEKITLTTGKKIEFVQLEDVPLSSTEIRRKVRAGENIVNLTPPQVINYIKQHNLYNPKEVLVSDYAEMTKFCASVALEKGGLSVQAYDVRNLTQPAEYTLAISGTSTRHAKAICEYIMKEVKERYGVYPQGTEGMNEGRWVVVDYGALMIHVFYDFVRNEYKIEDLWQSASRLSL